jgi:hypothetical protein
MIYTMQKSEILKESGYWRAKGFKREGNGELLDRCDCTITYKRKQWQHFDKLKNEMTITAPTLHGLQKII